MQIAENAIPRYSHIAIYEVDPKCDYGANESEVAERMSERADTAYSPRFREEEHSAATEQIAVYFSQMRLRCGRNLKPKQQNITETLQAYQRKCADILSSPPQKATNHPPLKQPQSDAS